MAIKLMEKPQIWMQRQDSSPCRQIHDRSSTTAPTSSTSIAKSIRHWTPIAPTAKDSSSVRIPSPHRVSPSHIRGPLSPGRAGAHQHQTAIVRTAALAGSSTLRYSWGRIPFGGRCAFYLCFAHFTPEVLSTPSRCLPRSSHTHSQHASRFPVHRRTAPTLSDPKPFYRRSYGVSNTETGVFVSLHDNQSSGPWN